MKLPQLLREVRACRLCEADLPYGPRPILQVSREARMLVVGQAPGRKVHETGIPFDDPSGERLRDWLGITPEVFYDPARIAILPMGFCYPGTGKSGDLPPRPECAATWRAALLDELSAVRLTVVIGQYAARWHLPDAPRQLTELVRDWKSLRPNVIPLPHPSPRNNIWLKKNPWFATEVLPYLRRRVRAVLKT